MHEPGDTSSKERIFSWLFQSRRKAVLWRAAILIAVIAVIDWYFEDNISFGFLYLFPMLLVGGNLTLLQIAAVAALCTGLTEAFDPFPWAVAVGISRLVLTFAAFFGTGFFGFAAARSRQLAKEDLEQVKREAGLRRRNEEQLEFLISNSPAAIFTLDDTAHVQMANQAAHKLLGIENGKLRGQLIGRYFPALASVPASQAAPFFHTEMECRARKQNDEVFLAHIWFSTYQTMSGPRLAAVVFDSSDELRDRAEFNLQQMRAGSKVLVGALCHEIRNISGAIGLVHAKLTRDQFLGRNEDFSALGSLVQALEKMAGLELRQTTDNSAESIDIVSVLEELRIVIEPSFQESEIKLNWMGVENLPRVWADRQALLQVFLNIAKNSQRALEGCSTKEFSIRASCDESFVCIRFIDTGPGVADPEKLFQAFQPGAQATGLGLYLSRTFLRSFSGDIDYEPRASGCCFSVKLATANKRHSHLEVGSNGRG